MTLFDMSKAFDSVNRAKPFAYLEEILQPDGLHLIGVLTNTPRTYVKFGDELGTVDSQLFAILLGIIHRNCLSAVLFIFYLTYVQIPGVLLRVLSRLLRRARVIRWKRNQMQSSIKYIKWEALPNPEVLSSIIRSYSRSSSQYTC